MSPHPKKCGIGEVWLKIRLRFLGSQILFVHNPSEESQISKAQCANNIGRMHPYDISYLTLQWRNDRAT